MSQTPPAAVAHRRVFYIPGFDPVAPRAYRERYRTQSARQAALSGYDIALTATDAPRTGWQVTAQIDGHTTTTRIDTLVWSDIVRASMGQGVAATYAGLWRTARLYIGSGALRALTGLRKGPVIAALYPVAVLLAQLALAILIALVAGGIMARAGQTALLAQGLAGTPVLPLVVTLTAYTIATGLALVFLRWCARRDHLLAWYLMQDYAFTASHGGAYPPAQEARLRDFADQIATALAADTDEVLIVGHSSGAHLAISVMADLLRAGHLPENGPAIGLLTLGQVVPMVSFLPRATRLRADLACLAGSDALTWVDVTAPGDGCSFALCDPVSVSGVTPAHKRWPLVLSAAFTQTLSPAARTALRWNLFERHFQYLNAFDALSGTPGDYDYFRITAGPQTLAARYAGRAPSQSRIEIAANPHPGRAA